MLRFAQHDGVFFGGERTARMRLEHLHRSRSTVVGRIFNSARIASVIFRAVRPDGLFPPVIRVAKK
jgi:hypothetical protein